jgi:hypothetical protein
VLTGGNHLFCCAFPGTADNKIMDLTLHTSVDEYFHDVVTEALTAVGAEASQTTEWYLVSLLGEFTHARITDEPLAVKLIQGADTAAERVRTLKQVGDTSLYVSGFFAESLGRKLVDVDFYASVGSSAYGQLANQLSVGAGGASIADVYRELSASFPQFVEVLGEVRRRVDFATTDVVKLYEQWLRTRDAWVERKLRAAGVLVDADPTVLQ